MPCLLLARRAEAPPVPSSSALWLRHALLSPSFGVFFWAALLLSLGCEPAPFLPTGYRCEKQEHCLRGYQCNAEKRCVLNSSSAENQGGEDASEATKTMERNDREGLRENPAREAAKPMERNDREGPTSGPETPPDAGPVPG